jgi:hypothetical protein
MASAIWMGRVALLATVLLAAGCGGGSDVDVVGGVDPNPGTFEGTTNNGGVITIIVGSVEAIDLVCDGDSFGGACTPPVQVNGGNATGTCGGVTFDLNFGSQNEVQGTVSAGTDCDGTVEASRVGGEVPTPTRTPTPGVNPPTATPTPTGGENPTPTPTDGGGPPCAEGDTIVVELSLDTSYGGAVTAIQYPPGSVNIPGSFGDDNVADRVTFTPTDGFEQVNDRDTNSDAIDDEISTSFAGTESNPAGPFVEVEFDCLAGQPRPLLSAFTCTVQSVSDEIGNPIEGVNCSLAIL